MPPKILVVDDEPTSFDVVEGVLYREPYTLHYASSGTEALRRLDSLKPDLVLLDMMMPLMDGASVCRQLRENPDWRHIPVIMVTALSSKEDLYNCLEAGADDFVGKPVNALELRARVRAMLRIKSQYDELVAARERVEQLSRSREEMAHAIVHDLRHPVTSMLFACELLLQASLDDPLMQRLHVMKAEAQRLGEMLNMLLLTAKMEAHHLTLQREAVDLSELIRDTLLPWRDAATQKQVQLQQVGDREPPMLNLDTGLLRRVLDNLITNALKYAPPESQITVGLETEAEAIVLTVADQGQGVDPQWSETIFNRFETGDALGSGSEHIGLELAFCRQAVQAHGGSLSVSANAPKGAVFSVRLPLSVPNVAMVANHE